MIAGVAAPSVKSPGGRPPSTTRERIADVAFELFSRQGFERTTVDEIAREAGVGRRTIFRYYGSKNEMVWGNFDRVLDLMRDSLAAAKPEAPIMDALREAVIFSNRYEPDQLPSLRVRMTLIVRNPALQGYSMVRYAAWRRVVAEFSAGRLGCRPDDLIPQAIAHAALGTTIAAFTRWVRTGDEELEYCLDEALRGLATGFSPAAIIDSR